MKKALKKFFTNVGNNDGDKCSQRFSPPRYGVSMANFIHHVKHNKSSSCEVDISPVPSTHHVEIIERGNADENVNSSSAASLFAAVSKGNLKLVEKLLTDGFEGEIVDEEGCTPFLKAVQLGNVDVVALMAANNAFQTDVKGNTALHLAIEREFLPIAEILVAYDPLVNVPNKAGDLPLHLAVAKESLPLVTLLLNNNAAVDVEDTERRTPLLIALKHRNIPLIQLLLKYGARRNEHSVIAFLSSNCDPVVKALFQSVDDKINVTPISNDNDSLNSEHSCVFPPVLSSPKSWNVLHPKLKATESTNSRKNFTSLLQYKRKKNFLKDGEKRIRKSSSKSILRIGEVKTSVQSTIAEKPGFEDCKKALEKLSLDAKNSMKNSDSLNENLNSIISVKSFNENVRIGSNSPVLKDLEERASLKNETKSYPSNNVIFNECTSSSDEEPLMWENSNDGGYFTEWSRSSKLSDINDGESRGSKSSSSEEEFDNLKHNEGYSVILNSLKEISQDNRELETEAAVLRESIEKLKYDLANCRQDVDTEKVNSSSVISHMAHFDAMYMKAVENTETFQTYIASLEREISYLKRTYNESCKVNHFLAEKLRKSLADVVQMKSAKCEACIGKNLQISKLREEIDLWKNKYERSIQSHEEPNPSSPFLQDLLDLHTEICLAYDKIVERIRESGVPEIQNHQNSISGGVSQETARELDRKLFQYLTNVLNVVENKNAKYNSEPISERNAEVVKQKLLLEVSKLNSILKDKEAREEQLKSQLHKLREEIQKSKSEKRSMLIRKTFRDKCSSNVNKICSKDLEFNFNLKNADSDL